MAKIKDSSLKTSTTEQLTKMQGAGIYGGIAELKDGRIMAFCPNDNAPLYVKYSTDQGQTWSKQKPLRDNQGKIIKGGGPGANDPSGLINLASGKLLIIYQKLFYKGKTIIDRALFTRTSSNDGKTWGRERRINQPGAWASNYHDTLIQLSSGRLILPVRDCFGGGAAKAGETLKKEPGGYAKILGKMVKIESHAHYPELDVAWVYYSDDEGKTWNKSAHSVMIWDGQGGIFPTDEPGVA